MPFYEDQGTPRTTIMPSRNTYMAILRHPEAPSYQMIVICRRERSNVTKLSVSENSQRRAWPTMTNRLTKLLEEDRRLSVVHNSPHTDN